ncbi:hypothetical protein GQX74_010031 [Glossina fuscipes]|nr:hypothetical protein GQX74_010031 [Glossina fuscipes]
MEEGDYWESFEISENESDNEIQSEYTDTDSSDDSDIIVQKKRKVYVIKSDTHDIGSYSEEIDEDDDDWQDITESDEVPVVGGLRPQLFSTATQGVWNSAYIKLIKYKFNMFRDIPSHTCEKRYTSESAEYLILDMATMLS